MSKIDLGPLADPTATTFEDHTRLFRIAFRHRFGPDLPIFAAETAEVETLYASGAPIEVIDALYPFPLLELLQGITPYREQEPWYSLLTTNLFTLNYYLPTEMWELLSVDTEATQQADYAAVEALIPPTRLPGETGPAQSLYRADGTLDLDNFRRSPTLQQNVRLNRTLFDILWYLANPSVLVEPLTQTMAVVSWDELYRRTATPPVEKSSAAVAYQKKVAALLEAAHTGGVDRG